MNEMGNFINAIAELTKHGIDMNPNFSEWEKWRRKSGVEEVKKLAKHALKKIIECVCGGQSKNKMENSRFCGSMGDG